jgi:DNA-binding response OmpR family regulator
MFQPLVLVAEDDWALAQSFQIALERVGFAVQLTTTAQAALEQVAACRPSLVVLDLHLADSESLPVRLALPQLLKACKTVGARVLAITGDARLAEYRQAEFDLVLLKPVSVTQLRDLARRLCDAAFSTAATAPD